ncbi:MAG TPA: RcnB family protein [Micropepsaceae bacterium]|nr:RcnB family protein [Micropepsaceae bacterium]
MKPLIFATLAMFWLSAPVLAQPQPQQQTSQATIQPDNPQGNLAGTHTNQTGSSPDNPAPHIYKRGEHISPSYGSFDVVGDWSRFHLAKPPDGSHWVKYGDNYLLVKIDDGQITDIVKAS